MLHKTLCLDFVESADNNPAQNGVPEERSQTHCVLYVLWLAVCSVYLHFGSFYLVKSLESHGRWIHHHEGLRVFALRTLLDLDSKLDEAASLDVGQLENFLLCGLLYNINLLGKRMVSKHHGVNLYVEHEIETRRVKSLDLILQLKPSWSVTAWDLSHQHLVNVRQLLFNCLFALFRD